MPTLRIWPVLVVLIVFAASTAALFGFGSYARHETINGTVEPVAGTADVRAPRDGIISSVLVEEGQWVAAGQPLMQLSLETTTKDAGAVGEAIGMANEREVRAIEGQRRASLELTNQQRDDIRVRRAGLDEQIDDLQKSEDLAKRKFSIAQSTMQRAEKAHEQGFISDLRMSQLETDSIQSEQELNSVHRQLAAARLQYRQLDGEERIILATQQRDSESIVQSEAKLSVQSVTNRANQTIVLTAPVAGRVSNMNAKAGQSVSAGDSVISVLPAGDELEAVLLAPSSAVGFMRSGDRVKLMYDAFPYANFGMADGRVVSVGSSPVSARPTSAEPTAVLYRVKVRLDRQTVTAFGREWPLSAGMKAQAVVVLEERSAIQWLFEPVLALRARSQL